MKVILETAASDFGCSISQKFHWSIYNGELHTCMTIGVTINSPETSIMSDRDGTVQGMVFDDNPEIKFLPINVHEKFPNIIGLSAWQCAIKVVSKKNFKNLSHLTVLSLARNQIEKVDIDTFDDLTSLEKLHLRKKIIFLDYLNDLNRFVIAFFFVL